MTCSVSIETERFRLQVECTRVPPCHACRWYTAVEDGMTRFRSCRGGSLMTHPVTWTLSLYPGLASSRKTELGFSSSEWQTSLLPAGSNPPRRIHCSTASALHLLTVHNLELYDAQIICRHPSDASSASLAVPLTWCHLLAYDSTLLSCHGCVGIWYLLLMQASPPVLTQLPPSRMCRSILVHGPLSADDLPITCTLRFPSSRISVHDAIYFPCSPNKHPQSGRGWRFPSTLMRVTRRLVDYRLLPRNPICTVLGR